MNKLISTVLGIFVVVVVVWGVWRMLPDKKAVTPTPEPTPVYEPVVYDVADWQISPKAKDAQTLLSHLGTATTDDAMDYYGNIATRYRYTALHEAPLYAIIGKNTLEVVWYHAQPKDDTAFKAQSQSHAKKVHALATAIYGADGKTLMQAILAQQSAPKLTGLIDAHCRAYQCRLIISTDKLGITTTKV